MKPAAEDMLQFEHHGACVVRTPLLPFDVVRKGVTRDAIRGHLKDPIVREALFLASPSLDAAIDAWLIDPADPRAHDVEVIVRRYLTRMASRPTPFGLFSGCAVARITERTRLTVGPRTECRRSSRLDMQYLALLAEAIEQDKAARSTLRFRPSSSLNASDDELRYIEARVEAQSRARAFHLVTVEPMSDLTIALEAASSGATTGEIADALVENDPTLPRNEAADFVDELVDAQLLESNVQPVVTGDDPLAAFASALARGGDATRDAAARIAQVHAELRALDEGGLGAPRERYRAIMKLLEPLPVALDPARLFQVDLFKPSESFAVGERVLGELRRALAALHRLAPSRGSRAMDRFRERFDLRYGEREVPLTEALDEERGLGFDQGDARTADPSPLLVGLVLPPAPPRGESLSIQDQTKLRRLVDLLATGEREWILDEGDLEKLQVANRAPLPDALAAMIVVAAESSEAVDAGDFEMLLHHAGGPSGASLLARFCHGDAGILDLVRRHIAVEEAHRPDALFAEIVHLPEGRLGNILCRPVLRSHEIPYLGVSGASSEQWIPVDDLRVSVRRQQVRLRSVRLDREVIPRLTSAHNHPAASLAMYRFLCALQFEGVASRLGWDWGALSDAPFLPRVKYGKVVLSLASWRIEGKKLERLALDAGERARLGLPRWVTIKERDNILPIDLEGGGEAENAAQLRALARGRDHVQLQELFPEPERMCASGSEGRYTHEMVIPMARVAKEAPPARATTSQMTARWTFEPGSRWLYAKIYMGQATSDRVLRTAIAPLVRELYAAGAIERWFFIRYSDPETHVRVRFEGDPERLLREVLPRLHAHLEPRLAAGSIARFQLDTYDREMWRYGGARGIVLAEQIFAADSDAVLAIVEATAGDGGADARWRLALYGMHAMLTDAGIVDDTARRALLTRSRDAFATEHRVDTPARKSLGARYRTERAAVESLLRGELHQDENLGPLLKHLVARSAAVAPVFAELAELRDRGELTTSWESLVTSFLHMHVNRMIRADGRTHELVLYDFLLRAHESAAARKK